MCEFDLWLIVFKHIVNSKLQSESVNGTKARQKEAKEPSLTTEPSSSRELCLVKPADDLPSDDLSVLILDKQVSTASDLLLEEARRKTKKETAMTDSRLRTRLSPKLERLNSSPIGLGRHVDFVFTDVPLQNDDHVVRCWHIIFFDKATLSLADDGRNTVMCIKFNPNSSTAAAVSA
ncbi:unnamed protein product [Brassica rapa]|uniref:Uncharacterized protein n=1 Tax=Brassica campestris TaxID=3711 RepID=A0A3P5ZQ60_BRACM|nr:unnamed protein product [Brassica rapa]VDC82252.1 unnamed protein product [Brassica rapa]